MQHRLSAPGVRILPMTSPGRARQGHSSLYCGTDRSRGSGMIRRESRNYHSKLSTVPGPWSSYSARRRCPHAHSTHTRRCGPTYPGRGRGSCTSKGLVAWQSTTPRFQMDDLFPKRQSARHTQGSQENQYSLFWNLGTPRLVTRTQPVRERTL